MKLATFGKILRGVGQGAAVVGQFTPVGGAVAAAAAVVRGAADGGAAAVDAPGVSGAGGGLDLDGEAGLTLREIAAAAVLDALPVVLDRSVTGGFVLRDELRAATDHVEAWLLEEQAKATGAAKAAGK